MDEEIVGDVAIAKLTYRGTGTPTINRPLWSGSYHLLGPTLRRENNEWVLYITERQDYETPIMRLYMFTIQIPGETQGSITLQIVNIDDNPPIIHVLNECVVPELGEAPRLTNCTYEVTDEDGEISTSAMTFRIDSDRNDDQIFFILGQPIPTDRQRMTMTLGLNRTLNFEINQLHIFRVTALDSAQNNHTVTIMVQVENVEHRPPRWVETFAVQQLDEMTAMNFTVRAIDGDTGINKPIYYRLEVNEEDAQYFDIKTIEGGEDGGIFQVFPIDRDELEREVFQLSLIAYKYDNESFANPNEVVIIIQDVNNKRPEPLSEVYSVSIPEATALTLHFDTEFGFHDKDLGNHARYSVRLESVYPPGAAEAFYIQPEQGYQRQTFIMGTANHTMLDYEVPEFQHIELRVIATDLDNPEFVGVATVYINLTNWNDELPIFSNDAVQTVSFNETVGEGFYVGTVRADDRDIGDTVVHSIMGTAQNIFTIDNRTGDIYVAVDEAFDYQRQNELLVQILAQDTLGEPYNSATWQLTIQLIDINNTPPTLRLPRGSPQVEENVPSGFPVTQGSQEITASDLDTSADLHFQIMWNTSYAIKQGRETDPSVYYNCLRIETVSGSNNSGTAVGRLFVNEVRPNVTIDFEEYEVLYLTVRVVDRNTEIGQDYDELTYTISIVDMNDNAPQWVNGTLSQELRVRENSPSNTIIGSVQATDIDGPLYNQVRYTIRPQEGTPDNLVKIDFFTGQIEVDLDGAIDADIPPRYNLYYTVIASDKCPEDDDCPPDTTSWETEGTITIRIIDINNKNPMARTDLFNTTVYIYENAQTGDEVVRIMSQDEDRDEIYSTVRYQINYAVNQRLRDFFSVELDTGRVLVELANEPLDRDGDEPTHRIFLTLIDNFYSEGDGNRNQNTTEIEVVLLDVNDNAPVLPTRNQLSWTVSENLQEGTRLSPEIFASDRDQPNTDNSRVGYEIVNLTITNRDIQVPELFRMFQIVTSGNIYNVSGELEAAVDLRGYWGTYDIGIRAFDHGDPPLASEERYELTVRPYNFHSPVFVFPLSGATIRLARERAATNSLLALVNGQFLDRIRATDEDGLESGTLSFEVTGDDAALEYFQIVNEGDNQGTLMLRELFTENVREFQIRIRATDGGTEPGPLFTETLLTAVFVPTQGDPVFTSNNTATVAFVEEEAGLLETHSLPLAQDPKNYRCDNDCHEIFYRIISGNEEGHFALDPVSNILSLNNALNRSESEVHTLRIAAANSRDAISAIGDSVLTVTVNVREANPRPYFVRPLYTAGISTLDTVNRELLTVQATHSDGLPIVYSMNMSSMVVDPSLVHVRDSAFVLQPASGVLTLNMQPTASMHGMFEFDVLATDPMGAQDRTAIKIYLISSLNRVFFIFINTLDLVEANTDFIEQTFSTAFNMTCNIDQVVPATNSAGVVEDGSVEVRAHFIRDDVPVSTDVIEDIRSDRDLVMAIQNTLSTRLLSLRDFVTGISPDPTTDNTQLATYVLAGLSALLAFLCLVLLSAYVIRTRALNRRLQALSMTKYGSQDSGLNRLVLAAPGTNKHATEGSNPIWNEAIKAPDFDAISEQSDDSDLIGIENLPQFRNDYFPPADDDSMQDMFKDDREVPVATHNNNFGFNPTPFSPEFANRNFNFK